MKNAHDLVMAAKSRIQETALEDADQAILEADVLLDVRESDEYAAGHLPGAIHISRGLLEFKLSGMPELSSRDLKIVSDLWSAGASFKKTGLERRSLSGGIHFWRLSLFFVPNRPLAHIQRAQAAMN